MVGTEAPAQLAEYPLGVLLAQGLIGRDMHEAGCGYARLFRLAIGGESVSGVNLTGRVFSAPGEEDEAWLAARARDYDRARRCLQEQGRRTRELVENVTVYQRLPPCCLKRRPPSPGEAIALDRLRAGLAALAALFAGTDRRAA
ncbi:MAG: hypothetical protein Kilf2KO_21120 [Rhodospirillales bacterium]